MQQIAMVLPGLQRADGDEIAIDVDRCDRPTLSFMKIRHYSRSNFRQRRNTLLQLGLHEVRYIHDAVHPRQYTRLQALDCGIRAAANSYLPLLCPLVRLRAIEMNYQHDWRIDATARRERRLSR